jgi:hypothetical protein
MYLLSKKDTDIRRRRDVISEKAEELRSMLAEQRGKKNCRIIKADTTTNVINKDRDLRTTSLIRSKKEKNKRKEISPLEGKGDNKKKRVMRGEVSYLEPCRGDGSGRATALEDIDSDSREEWSVVRSKKEKRNERPIGDKARRETIANECIYAEHPVFLIRRVPHRRVSICDSFVKMHRLTSFNTDKKGNA